MSEQRASYRVLNNDVNSVIVNTELETVREQLEEIERRLIPLLVTVRKALGKDIGTLTREERRHRA